MSDQTVESLTEELKAANAALEKAGTGGLSKEDQERLTFLEGDHKKLIKARDDAKEAKRAEEEKRLSEQGEFKTLAETRAAELGELTKRLEGLDGKLAEYHERDKKELDGLLPGLPENLRTQVSDESLPLEKRLGLARALTETKTKSPDYRPPGGGGAGDEKLTSTQRIAKGLKAGALRG